MSLRRLLQGTGADIAGTGTGIPGVGVPWKNVGPGGKPLLETGPLVRRPLFPILRGGTAESLPIVEPPYHARFGAGEMFQVPRKNLLTKFGKPQLESGEYQVESKPTSVFRSLLASPTPATGVEVPWKTENQWGKPNLETDYEVERKPRFQDLDRSAQKPIETQTVERPMPIRAGKTRRAIRDKTGIESRVGKARASSRIQAWRAQQGDVDKFTKEQTFYVDHSLYPFLSCRECIWFRPGETESDGTSRCTVVSETGGSGIINPEGTSTAFNASPARLKLIERAYGRGDGKKGVLPQVIRSRLMPIGKSLLYPDLPTELQQLPSFTSIGLDVKPNNTVNTGDLVTFTSFVKGGLLPYTATWDFGDGTGAMGTTTPNSNPLQQIHSYNAPGGYTVKVVVNDATGASVTQTAIMVVQGPAGQTAPTGPLGMIQARLLKRKLQIEGILGHPIGAGR